jgi:hypothetical protein
VSVPASNPSFRPYHGYDYRIDPSSAQVELDLLTAVLPRVPLPHFRTGDFFAVDNTKGAFDCYLKNVIDPLTQDWKKVPKGEKKTVTFNGTTFNI